MGWVGDRVGSQLAAGRGARRWVGRQGLGAPGEPGGLAVEIGIF